MPSARGEEPCDPGNPAAHARVYLPLLPSGPDGVRRLESHRTWTAGQLAPFQRPPVRPMRWKGTLHAWLAVTANGGGGGIRTHGTVARTRAFRARQFSRSCTPPHQKPTLYRSRAVRAKRSPSSESLVDPEKCDLNHRERSAIRERERVIRGWRGRAQPGAWNHPVSGSAPPRDPAIPGLSHAPGG